MTFTPETGRALDAMALDKQIVDRIPGLVAGVARSGELQWSRGVGSARLEDPGVAPDPDTQFSVASNTKTFVAATIMALRDEGLLSLDDRLDNHIPEAKHGDITIRMMLAHVSGMQREPVGDVWDVMEFPTREELVPGWNGAERILRPHMTHHYSNLCYAMLGEILARRDGGDWFASVRRRLLEPLELTRTTLGPQSRVAGAYFVPPWTDVPLEEPLPNSNAFSPAGGIASTLTDLAKWGGFLADPIAEVLHPDTVEEMCQPQIVTDTGWNAAWGLGLQLIRQDGRVWVGHTGGFPGAVTGCFTHRGDATTAILLMNASQVTNAGTSTVALGSYAVKHEPIEPEPWVPGTDLPSELTPLLGQWFSEGQAFTFVIRQGRLEARAQANPAAPPSVFTLVENDVYRTASGREKGELLRIHRDKAGDVTYLSWATYRFDRKPYAFGGWLG